MARRIAGTELCWAFLLQFGCDLISSLPENLYGPCDHFDLDMSHVIPDMIRKAHDAKC
jgi:GDP-L-fucose synthase